MVLTDDHRHQSTETPARRWRSGGKTSKNKKGEIMILQVVNNKLYISAQTALDGWNLNEVSHDLESEEGVQQIIPNATGGPLLVIEYKTRVGEKS